MKHNGLFTFQITIDSWGLRCHFLLLMQYVWGSPVITICDQILQNYTTSQIKQMKLVDTM